MLRNKYGKAFSLGLQNGLEYRSEFFFSLVSCLFPIFIQLFLWTNLYGQQGNSQMFGYSYQQMIVYSIMASIISRLTRTGFEYEVLDDIKNGGLNKYIIRPISYFPYKLFCFLGQKVMQFGLLAIVLAILMVVLRATLGYTFALTNLLLFLVSLILAFVLNFVIFFCVSLIAFWLNEIGFFFEAVRIVFIAFSGGIFPLDIFNGSFLSILHYMPFQYTVNFPVDILNGRTGFETALFGMMMQLFWILALSVAAVLIWRKGTRKYVAVGG